MCDSADLWGEFLQACKGMEGEEGWTQVRMGADGGGCRVILHVYIYMLLHYTYTLNDHTYTHYYIAY